MRVSLAAIVLSFGCTLPSDVNADTFVTLDALRWKSRVLLVPAPDDGQGRWIEVSDALDERDLLLFEERDGVFRQRFPKPESPTVLRLPESLESRVRRRVTLIGKDGGIKQQWEADAAGLPAAAFAAIDRMPMRQREARERSRSDNAGLVGTRAKEWQVGPEWANSKPLRLEQLRGRVLLVRFWTDTCPYCAASLPAMQKLADELADEPVTFVGLYQSKPFGSERPWDQAVARAKELGVRFPIAYDHEWKTLEAWWLDGGTRRATSASFVIAPDGTIAHVHPGPVFFPSARPEDAGPNADYEAIRRAIRALLRTGE